MAPKKDSVIISTDEDWATLDADESETVVRSDPSAVLTEKNKQRLEHMEIEWLHDTDWYPLQTDVEQMCRNMTVNDIEFMYWILTHLSPSSVYEELAEAAICEVLHLPIPKHPED